MLELRTDEVIGEKKDMVSKLADQKVKLID
jgi:hypothetical protein